MRRLARAFAVVDAIKHRHFVFWLWKSAAKRNYKNVYALCNQFWATRISVYVGTIAVPLWHENYSFLASKFLNINKYAGLVRVLYFRKLGHEDRFWHGHYLLSVLPHTIEY